MRNDQQRDIEAPVESLRALIDGVLDDDSVWPGRAWSPLLLDDGLRLGSRGGHGRIRYSVTEHEPGRRIRFGFDPALGITGFHEFRIEVVAPNTSRLRHTLVGRTHGSMILLWPLMIRWLHEAVIQDLFDNVERSAAGGLVGSPADWSPWVRLLRRLIRMPSITDGIRR